ARVAEHDARKRAEEEARHRAVEDERLSRERVAAEKRKADEDARKAAEETARRHAEQEAARRLEKKEEAAPAHPETAQAPRRRRAVDVIKVLMKSGQMATVNDVLDADTAELVAAEYGHTVKGVAESEVLEG